MQAAGQTSHRVPRGSARNEQTDERDHDRQKALKRDRTGSTVVQEAVRTDSITGNASGMSADRVQAALAAALQSREFQSAPQLRAFLGFIVRATLDHEQEKLKGYTIAVEALGRPEDFNPVTDPIVRVEAARLRRRLEKYYAGSGADDPVRIIVPKGSYAPEFQLAFCPGPHDRAVGGLLELQEVGREFEPASARAPDELDAEETTQAIGTADKPARIVAGPRHDNAASAPVIEPPTQTGPADWSQFTGRLAGHSVPLPVTLLIGGACFLAGYLFG